MTRPFWLLGVFMGGLNVGIHAYGLRLGLAGELEPSAAALVFSLVLAVFFGHQALRR